MEKHEVKEKETKETAKKKVGTILIGEVVSTKADKTVSVYVERIFQHPAYKKIVRKKKKYLVHDEQNRCKSGDIVKIKLVRPISKMKRWLLVDILSTAPKKEEEVTL
ncbi:MAG: small subunit ribosomal protein [Acidobacteriota bacterium]|nr:small subunit ribosomal protein [Acidobacteriota bacterium]